MLGLVAFVLFFILFFTGLAPFDFEFPGADIEGSWILASVYAGLHHLAYGTQFVFTNGPLFPLYHREWANEASGWYVLARFALGIYLAWGFALLSANMRLAAWPVVCVAFVLLWPAISYQANDGILLVIPLLAALLTMSDLDGWAGRAVGVTAAAAVALGKFSFLPFCLGAFLLADIGTLYRRQLPLSLPGFATASFVLFLVSGQQSIDFLPYLLGGLEMTSGYTSALALDGPIIELIAYLGLWAAVLFIVVLREIGLVRRGKERRSIALLRVLLLVGFLLISLKAGFVRQDTHSYAAWGMLSFAVILIGLPGTLPGWSPSFSWIYYSLPLVVVGLLCGFFLVTNRYVSELTTQSARVFSAEVIDGVSFAQNPAAWLSDKAKLSDAANAQIRAAQPLPPLAGTIDAIANTQASIIAAGLDYAPRPTVQENMTFSMPLVARNSAFLSGPSAPDHLLFAPGATDSRHPASVEGSLWPLLLSHYAIAGEAAGQLILDKRSTPTPSTLGYAADVHTGFGKDVAVPAAEQPIVLKLDIRETVLGRLADLLLKPPLVYLVVTYADGRRETYRLIPGMIVGGIVISPTIRTIADYRALAAGQISGLDAPTTIRIDTPGAWAYDDEISGSFATLTIPRF